MDSSRRGVSLDLVEKLIVEPYCLLLVKDQKWKAVRQPLNKTLNQMTVTGMIDKFHKHTDQLVVKFESCLDQQKFDLLNVCMRFGMEQIFGKMMTNSFFELEFFIKIPLMFIRYDAGDRFHS